jgi:hypothetical protein
MLTSERPQLVDLKDIRGKTIKVHEGRRFLYCYSKGFASLQQGTARAALPTLVPIGFVE